MSLRERLRGADAETGKRDRFQKYGVLDNPFPAAGQPVGHPRREDDVDGWVANRVGQFDNAGAGRPSQVVTVEGTQGVGKTNLLNFYEQQLRDYYQEDEAYYIIRYYPDPEPTFDSLLRKVFQNLDESHFAKIGRKLAASHVDVRNQAKEIARGYEVRIVLNSLEQAGANEDLIAERARLALEWFVGLRVLKRHRDELGVSFRLDTAESRTQALRDIVYVSEKLGLLKGILLLLDELEKQDYSLSKTPVLRFLSANRALIDALPTCLFLMLAMTPQARLRYFCDAASTCRPIAGPDRVEVARRSGGGTGAQRILRGPCTEGGAVALADHWCQAGLHAVSVRRPHRRPVRGFAQEIRGTRHRGSNAARLPSSPARRMGAYGVTQPATNAQGLFPIASRRN